MILLGTQVISELILFQDFSKKELISMRND